MDLQLSANMQAHWEESHFISVILIYTFWKWRFCLSLSVMEIYKRANPSTAGKVGMVWIGGDGIKNARRIWFLAQEDSDGGMRKIRVWELWREEAMHKRETAQWRGGGRHDKVQGCKGEGDSHTDTPRRLVNRGLIVPEEANLTSVSEVMSFPAKQQHFLSPSSTLSAPVWFFFLHFFPSLIRLLQLEVEVVTGGKVSLNETKC